MFNSDTIVALATPAGAGAIGIIRISGEGAISLAAPFFKSIRNKDLKKQKSHTVHFGQIVDADTILDEALVSVFKGPHSYTGEDVVEISCHGSPYIQQQIIQLLLRNGCRSAHAGEFTLRAFLNGKLDLSQAEAVADLIAADNEASHQIAMQQMRGGFSNEIKKLRDELLDFASLIELELDFAEEDVEFADRTQFTDLLNRISTVLKRLIDSFAVGNVIKNGIPVAIVGEPNVGKSTLLNALLNEDRALVSEIAGTTRDTIEDDISIGGIGFRFIDTAGIRETKDIVEGMGIQKTFEKIEKAQVVLYLVDSSRFFPKRNPSAFGMPPQAGELFPQLQEIEKIRKNYPEKPLVVVVNKIDQIDRDAKANLNSILSKVEGIVVQMLSAKRNVGLEELQTKLLEFVNTGALKNNDTIITNTRHYNSLLKALEEVEKVQLGLTSGVPSDLLAIDIRQALYHFGEITGEITSDDLLGNIFANFCIGK
ncbi:tRNA uridine-5-carboxymethylaminomethyl(34) synthesis GTPase MnmE [Aggregatimonas sangjinii]|uniref:tRNA modification GTPase MnmE n=1 Tax=Aggregatimonas sangjinii TaxID=2583587 RepID=A0A5B7SRQ3_9FLAO|nr:tRNA uridine-5-carboxymethylaminomethyl(34) synthesis GTPase MnmE [Aggregatimonas sangjinii]QCW99687.1 tRNA uridine-5-carboxymethylaminomethyl(34) synthesis GTPase MnmE [Aggregatimonas sangjinii]